LGLIFFFLFFLLTYEDAKTAAGIAGLGFDKLDRGRSSSISISMPLPVAAWTQAKEAEKCPAICAGSPVSGITAVP
jgi:hypothetical protein